MFHRIGAYPFLVSPKFQKRSALKFAGRNETQTLKSV
jgi:hypothetical protein